MKIVTIVGTRPEIIKLSRVINELENSVEHVLLHTGQNYDFELNEIFFSDLGIKLPDIYLGVKAVNGTQAVAEIISKIDKHLEKIKPDAVLVYGDTNSCLGVYAAKRKKIPIFHMEAGNRCFDLNVPEEINRKIVDHLSDINLVISEHARRYLISEGFPPERIIKVGSSMPEVLNHHLNKINSSNILEKLNLNKHEYFLASIHREENVDVEENLKNIIEGLDLIGEKYQIPVVMSTHPRTRKKIESLNIKSTYIQFLKPFGFTDYINLQKNSKCVLSDSGTITEESSILKFPAITLRKTHERPEGMDETSIILSDTIPYKILESVNLCIAQFGNFKPKVVEDYTGENISYKIVRLIFSYKDYINRYVWRK